MSGQSFKLVTIVCEPVLLTSVLTKIRALGASGFTITDVRGEGSSEKSSGEVPDQKTKIEVVVRSESSQMIMEAIAKEYFKNYSLIVYSSDIQVIRREKF